MAGITLAIEVDDKGTVQIKRFADELKKAMKEMTEAPKQAQGSLNSLRDNWIGLTAKVTAATAVVYGVSKVLSSFINKAAEAEQIENRLRFALETTGYTWQYAKSAVDEFATSIQETTRFSDEQARQALTDMMMYTNDFAKAQMGAKLAMDMSIRTGQGLESTSRLIGMAMSGNVEMLGRYIPQLRNLDNILGGNATMAQKAEYALKILNEKFGGTAQADITTYAGKVAQFKNAWSDVKKEIGGHTLPILGDLLNMLTKISRVSIEAIGGGGAKKQFEIGLHYWEQVLQTLQVEDPYNTKAIKEAETYIDGLRERIQDLESGYKSLETKKDIFVEEPKKLTEAEQAVNKALEAQFELRKAIGDLPYEVPTELESMKMELRSINLDLEKEKANDEIIQKLYSDQYEIMKTIGELPYEAATEAETAAMSIRTLNRELEERLRIEAAISKQESEQFEIMKATGQLPYEVPTETETMRMNIRSIEKQMAESSKIGEIFASNMASAWNFNIKNIIKDSENMGDAIKNIFTGMADAFTSAISKMISDWILFGSITGKTGGTSFFGTSKSGLGGIIGGIASIFGLKEGGIISGWKPISAMQEGGIIKNPTFAIIGEAGPEAVVPLKSGKIPIEGGGKTVILNNFYTINAIDPPSWREFVKRNPGPIIEVTQEDIMENGPMRATMKGA